MKKVIVKVIAAKVTAAKVTVMEVIVMVTVVEDGSGVREESNGLEGLLKSLIVDD